MERPASLPCAPLASGLFFHGLLDGERNSLILDLHLHAPGLSVRQLDAGDCGRWAGVAQRCGLVEGSGVRVGEGRLPAVGQDGVVVGCLALSVLPGMRSRSLSRSRAAVVRRPAQSAAAAGAAGRREPPSRGVDGGGGGVGGVVVVVLLLLMLSVRRLRAGAPLALGKVLLPHVAGGSFSAAQPRSGRDPAVPDGALGSEPHVAVAALLALAQLLRRRAGLPPRLPDLQVVGSRVRVEVRAAVRADGHPIVPVAPVGLDGVRGEARVAAAGRQAEGEGGEEGEGGAAHAQGEGPGVGVLSGHVPRVALDVAHVQEVRHQARHACITTANKKGVKVSRIMAVSLSPPPPPPHPPRSRLLAPGVFKLLHPFTPFFLASSFCLPALSPIFHSENSHRDASVSGSFKLISV